MIFWIVFAVLAEWYSVGIALLEKRKGIENYGLCLIPFVAFFRAQRIAGSFTVFGIKTEKWGRTVVALTVVTLCAYLYMRWGESHLRDESIAPLIQIMILPIAACMLIFWAGMAKSALRILFTHKAGFKGDWILCWLLLPIPILLIRAQSQYTDALRQQEEI